jgi:DNA replication protein DnaC
VGTGKTLLAAAVANEFSERHSRGARFVRWPKALHELQPGTLSDSERRRLEQALFKAPLLIMDDVGAERDQASDFTRRMALLTYEERGDAGLRTVLTSNLNLDELARHFGDDRLSSRIAGRADVVVVTGEDLRIRRPSAE